MAQVSGSVADFQAQLDEIKAKFSLEAKNLSGTNVGKRKKRRISKDAFSNSEGDSEDTEDEHIPEQAEFHWIATPRIILIIRALDRVSTGMLLMEG